MVGICDPINEMSLAVSFYGVELIKDETKTPGRNPPWVPFHNDMDIDYEHTVCITFCQWLIRTWNEVKKIQAILDHARVEVSFRTFWSPQK